ncbi:MAG: hypothetical protein Q4A16_02855 [Lautropia sp.]|nr:hypothetical protein [Lautropia sp.]
MAFAHRAVDSAGNMLTADAEAASAESTIRRQESGPANRKTSTPKPGTPQECRCPLACRQPYPIEAHGPIWSPPSFPIRGSRVTNRPFIL